jgi:hypothetical protein
VGRTEKGLRIALVVAHKPPDAGLLAVLRLTGYTLQFERSAAAARASLAKTVPELALIGNLDDERELHALFEELKDICPQIVVSSTDDATLLLADRLGLLVQRAPAQS